MRSCFNYPSQKILFIGAGSGITPVMSMLRWIVDTAADVDAAVILILEQMTQTLTVGDRIEIRGFGSFALNYRPPRQGRNPKTGQKVEVPAKHVPHFKAGKELSERVDLSGN